MFKKVFFLFLVNLLGIEAFKSQDKISILKKELSKDTLSYTTKIEKYKLMTFNIPVFEDAVFNNVIEKLYENAKEKDDDDVCNEFYADTAKIEIFFKINTYTDKLLSITKYVSSTDCRMRDLYYHFSYNYIKYNGELLSVLCSPDFTKKKSTILKAKELLDNDPDCSDYIDENGLKGELIFSNGKGFLKDPVVETTCEFSLPIEINEKNIIFDDINKSMKNQ